MLRRQRQIRMQIHELLDACLFAISFWLAYSLRAHPLVIDVLGLNPVAPFENIAWLYLILVLILIPTAPLVLEAQGFYDRPLLAPRRVFVWPLFKGCFLVTVALVLAMWFLRVQIARWVVIWSGAISFGLIYLKEELLRLVYKRQLQQPQFRRRFLLVGTEEELARLQADLRPHAHEGIEVIAKLTVEEATPQRLVELLHEHSINSVILCSKHTHLDKLEEIVRLCELEGVETWLVADFFRTQISRPAFDDLFGKPVLVFRTTPEASWQAVFKHVMDFFGALVLLIILAVPMAIIALLIKLTSPGPVLFKQQRAGLNGRPFTMYKFRTMVTNAEQLKHELAALNEMNGPVFKITDDPRITPIGKWLRKFSLDELPQLVNVLRGEMSLVGPRPLPVDEVRQFTDLSYRRRLSVRPGLTCLWQISGRSNVRDFKEWVRLDLEYIDNWSLWLDFKILLRTLPVVLSGAGAK